MRMTFILIILITLAVTACATGVLIPYFKKKQFGQYIREEGPQAHLKKAGTPTMGGIAIMLGIIIGMIAGYAIYSRNTVAMSFPKPVKAADLAAVILTMLGFGAIGFLDDFEKIVKKNNLGLTAKQKMLLQIIFSIALAVYVMKSKGSDVFIPFAKIYVGFGWFFVLFVIFVEVAMTNSVNLTDGLDGLASSVTVIVALCFALVGLKLGNGVLVISGTAIAGSLLGFLIFNKNPAKIFMGDTGSMALGGALSAIAVTTKTEFLLPIAGLIYVAEALSVIIQVTYFKKTGGKRFFRMAPIHHHFELGGMNEKQVVALFCVVTAVCSVIAYFATV